MLTRFEGASRPRVPTVERHADEALERLAAVGGVNIENEASVRAILVRIILEARRDRDRITLASVEHAIAERAHERQVERQARRPPLLLELLAPLRDLWRVRGGR